MTSLLLGLRLLLGAGRGNRVRFALMAIGGSVGVCCLAVVLSIPGILAAQDGRMAARESIQPRKADGRLIDDGHPLILVLPDAYGARPLVRVFIAPGSRKVEPPPGLKALPRPGQVFVSPRLRELIRERRGLEQRFPGRQAGVIEADGLARPGELIGYVGVDRADLPGGLPFKGFGSRYPPTETVEPGTLDIVRFTMAGVVLLPLAVFLSVCARLSAAERARRLAALRLLGMSAKATQRVNAVETVAAAVVGSAVGLGEYWLLNQLVSRVGLPGFTWYPADGALSSTTLAVCLVGCPMLAWFVGRAGARRAASDPLAVRRSAVDAPPSRWGFLPLLAGTGIAAGYCVAGATGHAPRETSVSSVLIPLAVILIGIGLAASLPALSRFVARRTAGSTESLSLGLAMRRNEVEPGGALRVATGLVLLVFAASLVQGVLIELDQVSRNTSPVQEYDIDYEEIDAAQRRAIAGLPDVRVGLLNMQSDSGDDARTPSTTAFVATCDQVRKAVLWVGECVDGRPARLWDTRQIQDSFVSAGDTVRYTFVSGERSKQLALTVPARKVQFRDRELSPFIHSGDLLLPPSMVPSDMRPTRATLSLLSRSDADTVGRVLNGIGKIAPTADVLPQALNVEALQQISVVKSLLGVGMVLGLVIGVAAYVVAAADRAVERRPQVTALALLGARTRTLRAVQVVQVVVPLGVGLVLAVVAGKVAESGYLVTGGGSVFWDGDGVPLLLGCAVGAVAVAALGALPLVGRRIDPELIRRD